MTPSINGRAPLGSINNPIAIQTLSLGEKKQKETVSRSSSSFFGSYSSQQTKIPASPDPPDGNEKAVEVAGSFLQDFITSSRDALEQVYRPVDPPGASGVEDETNQIPQEIQAVCTLTASRSTQEVESRDERDDICFREEEGVEKGENGCQMPRQVCDAYSHEREHCQPDGRIVPDWLTQRYPVHIAAPLSAFEYVPYFDHEDDDEDVPSKPIELIDLTDAEEDVMLSNGERRRIPLLPSTSSLTSSSSSSTCSSSNNENDASKVRQQCGNPMNCNIRQQFCRRGFGPRGRKKKRPSKVNPFDRHRQRFSSFNPTLNPIEEKDLGMSPTTTDCSYYSSSSTSKTKRTVTSLELPHAKEVLSASAPTPLPSLHRKFLIGRE